LAGHCTQAGQIEKAARLWGKAGQRSLNRSALVEAAEQLTRALEQIATLPSTPELRRERINLQVALIVPQIHVRGYAAPETRAAVEQARLLIEQAEAKGEPLDDPLMLFSVLFASWTSSISAFDGDVVRELAAQFMALAEKQKATAPFMDGHRMIGISCLFTGDLLQARENLDRAIALYEPTHGRSVGVDARAGTLARRSWALWLLGYPEAALADSDDALAAARGIAESPTMLFALPHALLTHILCGDYAQAQAEADQLSALADSKGATIWKFRGTALQGCLLALTGKSADAVQVINAGIAGCKSIGTTLWLPVYLSYLAQAHAALGEFDGAQRCIGEAMSAMNATKETWWQSETMRLAGEIALLAGQPDPARIEAYFLRALDIARAQQAKSFELRAAMSLTRLCRRDAARDLLAGVYGSFSEGFDTLDLKAARTLLDTLGS
jgi:predicted ATPase